MTETLDLLTPQEVADMLRVSKRTVERLNIPHAKVGRLCRYRREDVLEYIREKVA